MSIIISGWSFGLKAYGEKVIAADTYSNDNRFKEKDLVFELEDEIETVEEGFFDQMPHLVELRIAPSVKSIGVSPKFEEILHKNKVLIRGPFDSYAEEFARKYKLRFLHSDIELACVGDYFERGNDLITLKFHVDSTEVYQDERCQGSSAGSVGGGVVSFDIPWDFFLDGNAQENIAGQCWGNCYEAILKSQEFTTFLEKAREKFKVEKHKKMVLLF
ncbi:MAG: hypothetical protein IK005_07235 [Paludibacteraceae bacterium]|nr:hypothetical protein [Paludibacteraceae bacterium]